MEPTIEEFLLERLKEIEPLLDDFGFTIYQTRAIIALYHNQLDIIEWHKNWPVLVEKPPIFDMKVNQVDVNSYTMSLSKQMAWMTQEEYRKRFGSEPPTAPLLLKMVQNFSWHPDFQEEWRMSDGA